MSLEQSTTRLSVCVITYNHARHIEACVCSVLDQVTDFPFEIIIADDCSTDGSSDIIDHLASRHPERIRVLRPPRNIGGTQNFLRLHNAARGEYVAHIDGDDIMLPSKLARQVACLDADREIVAYGHAMAIISEDGQPTGKAFPHALGARVSLGKVIRCGMPFLNSSLMYRRAARTLKQADFEVFDWFALTDIMLSGPAGYIDAQLGCYRLHGQSYTSATSAALMRERMLENVTRRYKGLSQYRSDVFGFAILDLVDAIRRDRRVTPVHWRLLRDSLSPTGLMKAVDGFAWRRQNGPALARPTATTSDNSR